jgi:hypothetical protein
MEYRLIFSREEILALDHYFTNRVGFIGHEDAADKAAHALADLVSEIAKEITQADADHSNR